MHSDYDEELKALRGVVGALSSLVGRMAECLIADGSPECAATMGPHLKAFDSARTRWHKWRTERFEREVRDAESTINKAFLIGDENEAYYKVHEKWTSDHEAPF